MKQYDMTPSKNSERGGVTMVTWPLILGVLNANSSKMARGSTNFKFFKRAPRQRPRMTPEKKILKRGRSQGHMTHP